MKRLCPSCGTFVPIWRWNGPVAKYHRQPGSSWLRFEPQSLYCRGCRVELRVKYSPIGRIGFGLMLALLLVFAFALLDTRTWGSLEPYRHYIGLLSGLCCFPLCLLIARWGTNLTVVDGAFRDKGALSNNAWSGRDT